jgi:hypothetical protein
VRTNGHHDDRTDPAFDVRAGMRRSVADVSTMGDLVDAVHHRAARIRRRRGVAGGVAAALGTTVVIGAAAMVPTLAASDRAPTAVAAPTSATAAPTPPGPIGPTPAGPTVTGTRPADPSPPRSTAGAPWGPVRIDEDFSGSTIDSTLWSVYDGPGDALGRWSPTDVAVRDGALRLSVSRPGGEPPSRWGGVGATGSPQRYGRWEVRLRMSSGRGVIGQFLLSPVPGSTADPAPSIVVSLAPYQSTISVSGNGTGAGGMRVAPLKRPTGYHSVAVEWTPARVRVLLDAAVLFEWTDARLPVPLWPAVQTIMAGPDCGAVPRSTDCLGATVVFPQRFDVDRVRVRALRD